MTDLPKYLCVNHHKDFVKVVDNVYHCYDCGFIFWNNSSGELCAAHIDNVGIAARISYISCSALAGLEIIT